MKKHDVIAEFVDINTGDRIVPAPVGEEPVQFTPADDAQATRLVDAGCLRAPVARGRVGNSGAAGDQ